MTMYWFNNKSLRKVETTTFSNEGIWERQHIQAALRQQIDVIAPGCLVISEEFSEWSGSQRRIDLLAIDQNANLVVIELKRTDTGEQMELQALRYAAMVSTLTFNRAVEIYQKYLISIGEEGLAEEKLLTFLDWGDEAKEDSFALDVRIILVSADFSKELTTSVMWLNERNLDIRCVRLIPYKHQEQLFVDVQQIIPLPEVASYQIKIKQQSEERREARMSSRDYSRYIFNGVTYNKRKLVLAVIKQWIADNCPQRYAELVAAFPQTLRTGGMFVSAVEANETHYRQGIERHFLANEDLISFEGEGSFAISNQWGKGNIENFLAHAESLGYAIEMIG